MLKIHSFFCAFTSNIIRNNINQETEGDFATTENENFNLVASYRKEKIKLTHLKQSANFDKNTNNLQSIANYSKI